MHKSHKIAALISVLTVVSFSCNNNDDLTPAPVITDFNPGSGLVGGSVTIYGNHFIPPVAPEEGVGPHVNTSVIKFNGIPAEAEYVYQDSIDKQRINVIVPIGATTGTITVTANGLTTTSSEVFVVTVPIYLPNVTVSTASTYGGVDIDVDLEGNFYVANNDLLRIDKISATGDVSTLLSTSPDNERIPLGITVDDDENVYATVGHTIQKITTDGTVTTLAGSSAYGYADGPGAEAKFYFPFGIDVDDGGNVYVADLLNNKIRKITPDGMVSTLAGSAQFDGPIGVAVDPNGVVFVTEAFKIRKIATDGIVSTIAGSTPGYNDGPATTAQFNSPHSAVVDASGNIYVTDQANFVVRRISPDGMVVTVAGSIFGEVDGMGVDARFCYTSGIAMDENGAIFITQGGGCGKIRKIVIN